MDSRKKGKLKSQKGGAGVLKKRFREAESFDVYIIEFLLEAVQIISFQPFLNSTVLVK